MVITTAYLSFRIFELPDGKEGGFKMPVLNGASSWSPEYRFDCGIYL